VAPDRLLIVTDVDGTLLDEHGALPCTARVLRAHLVAVQSARSWPVDMGPADVPAVARADVQFRSRDEWPLADDRVRRRHGHENWCGTAQ